MSAVIERVSSEVARLQSRVLDPTVPAETAARDAANPLVRAVIIEALRFGLLPRDSDELGVVLEEITAPDHPLLLALTAMALPLVERRRAAGGSR